MSTSYFEERINLTSKLKTFTQGSIRTIFNFVSFNRLNHGFFPSRNTWRRRSVLIGDRRTNLKVVGWIHISNTPTKCFRNHYSNDRWIDSIGISTDRKIDITSLRTDRQVDITNLEGVGWAQYSIPLPHVIGNTYSKYRQITQLSITSSTSTINLEGGGWVKYSIPLQFVI